MSDNWNNDDDYWDDVYFEEQRDKGAYSNAGNGDFVFSKAFISILLACLAACINKVLGYIVLLVCVIIAICRKK